MEAKFTAANLEFQKNVKAWLYCIAVLCASRILFLLLLRDRMPEDWHALDLLAVFRTGAVVDGKVAMYWMIGSFVLGITGCLFARLLPLASYLRGAVIVVFTLATPILTFGMAGYYQEFNDVFTQFMFEVFHDDSTSVMLGMVHEYALLPKFVLSLFLSIGCYSVYRRWFTGPFPSIRSVPLSYRSHLSRCSLFAIWILFCVVAMRGSLGSRPFQRANTAISKHRFLNKAVYNPYFALHYANRERRVQTNYTALSRRYSESDARKTLAQLSHSSEINNAGTNSDLTLANSTLIRTANGSPNGAPSHIFLLFLESYDAWPLLDKYKSLDVVPYGRQFAQAGCHVRAFLPAANSSVISYAATINGLQNTNPLHQQELPTSLVHIAKRLGYTTRNIGGFASSWQRFEEHTIEQGFDEFYSTDQIKPTGELPGGQLLDRTLFEFVERQLRFDSPTFNVIRSSSYHSPYRVDLDAAGCQTPTMPEDLRKICDGDVSHLETIYGHLKYTDMVMGQFIERMEQRYPRALFVITGDHFCRRFLNHDPNTFERSAVPLILYGKAILSGRALPGNACGSHTDIAATITEISAPAGFKYAALGRDLFEPEPEPIAIGTDFVIMGDQIVCLTQPASVEPLPWVPNAEPIDKDRVIAMARDLHESQHGLGFHLANNALQQGVPLLSEVSVADQAFPKRVSSKR